MERKNMVLLTVIAVATLLVAVVGATFAYFTATVNRDEGYTEDQGQTTLNTATLANTTTVVNVENTAGKFTASDIYPGHMEVAALSVKVETSEAVEQDTKYSIPFIYDVTANTIGKNVKYYLYKGDKDIAVNMGCTIKTTGTETVQYSEECLFTNANGLNQHPSTTDATEDASTNVSALTLVASGSLNGGVEKIQMIDEIEIANQSQEKQVYYYFVVEFVDTENEQNTDQGKELVGTITVAGLQEE